MPFIDLPFPTRIGIVVASLLLAIILGAFVDKRFRYLGQSGVAVLVGTMLGIATLVYSPPSVADSYFAIQHALFFEIVLPPIIFTAGYTLKKKNIFLNFGLITLLGVIATLISFGFIASATTMLTAQGWLSVDIHPLEALHIGAVLSATDSVAVLTSLDPATHPQLYGVLTGEGVLNDALALVLFHAAGSTLQSLRTGPLGTMLPFESHNLIHLGVDALRTALGSMATGVGFGLLGALLLKVSPFLEASREIAVLTLVGYMSYVACEGAGLSGILSLFTCGATAAHYSWYSLSETSRVSTRNFFHAISCVAETFCFLSLGFQTVFSMKYWNPALVFWELIVIMISRLLCVVLLTFMANLFRSAPLKISWQEQVVMWWGGIIRGALTFALSLQIQTPNAPVIISTVFCIVFTTTLLGGFFTNPLIHHLNIPIHRGSESPEEQKLALGWFHRFDDRFLKSFFRRYCEDEDTPMVLEERDPLI
eukprot:NODE_751_length_1929_cov_32.207979_g696_i0.p1 GENE.NODE_751_length_1929_cov_32.207979_g696_i0~~NODE_751_length_1929_cov_32.207979_g696_i0.p1  ORF type:complete len:480 (+),score=85.27 NODE_751_length_1929_cov_32.207979_g696_i0:232-1671(+)